MTIMMTVGMIMIMTIVISMMVFGGDNGNDDINGDDFVRYGDNDVDDGNVHLIHKL